MKTRFIKGDNTKHTDPKSFFNQQQQKFNKIVFDDNLPTLSRWRRVLLKVTIQSIKIQRFSSINNNKSSIKLLLSKSAVRITVLTYSQSQYSKLLLRSMWKLMGCVGYPNFLTCKVQGERICGRILSIYLVFSWYTQNIWNIAMTHVVLFFLRPRFVFNPLDFYFPGKVLMREQTN